MRIGIYGGTFNPVHTGHLKSAITAMSRFELDKLIFVPTAIPPHKELPKGTPTPEERLEMLRIAVDSEMAGYQDKVEIDDLELCREGPSYTSDTLWELKQKYPNDELWLLMGSDMFLSLHNWYQPGAICTMAHIGAFEREGMGEWDAMVEQADRLERDYRAQVTLSPISVVEVSSTQIREALREGERPEELPIPVYGYILRHGSYGTHADLSQLSIADLRACSLSMVYAKRHAHILGVEETAVKLADLWGADPDLARRAGILHDCTKYLTPQEHFDLCASAGVPVDPLERENPKLLHAKTGAILAEKVYGQPREVYDAIFWHTTGRADMTLLETILYVADYIEPNRAFEGVDEMRRLAFTDLNGALLMGLQMAIDDLKKRGLVIHHNTQEAYDGLIKQRKGS